MTNIAVDYLSFSVDLVNKIDNEQLCEVVTHDALRDILPTSTFEGIFLDIEGWERSSGTRPYSFGRQNRKVGVFVWFGGHSNALVQFSGNGCKFLDRNNWLYGVLACVHDRITRLDIAIDIDTGTSPMDFVKAGYNSRIKSYGEQRSASGDTCYIGSRKSSKFCRVYRYKEPHPRHKLLRIEYETKKGQAQIAARSILENGIQHAAHSLTKYYDWKSEEMPKPDDMIEKMQSEVTQRSEAKTLYWILTQVVPAFRKLVESGTIENPVEFLEEHFLGVKGNDENE